MSFVELLAILALLYAVLYFLHKWYMYEVPKLTFNKSEQNLMLLKSCPSLQEPYRYPIWGSLRHLQSLYSAFVRRCRAQKWERVTLEGATTAIIIDFAEPEKCTETTPTIVFIPGIAGSSSNEYAKGFTDHMLANGWRVAVYNRPGCGTTSIDSPDIIMMGETSDIITMIDYIHAKYPHSPMVGAGLSLGGNSLVRYCGEVGTNTPLIGGISLCQGYDMITGMNLIKSKPIYNFGLAIKLASLIKKHEHVFSRNPNLDVKKLKKIRSVHEFDQLYTSKLGSVSDLQTHYGETSSVNYLHAVRIPMLLANALDDPIVPEALLPYTNVNENSNLLLITTKYGGHGGWFEGFIVPSGTTWMDRISVDFTKALLKNASSLKDQLAQ